MPKRLINSFKELVVHIHGEYLVSWSIILHHMNSPSRTLARQVHAMAVDQEKINEDGKKPKESMVAACPELEVETINAIMYTVYIYA